MDLMKTDLLFLSAVILTIMASINIGVITWREVWELLEKKNRKI